jgi:predicted PurR-regulated permease PerM
VQGKLIDSLIMTVICFTLFSIAKLPYAALITLITVVTNLIPYFGPFIGAIPSGIIILISDPSKLLVFVILILIIQQIEGNIIEPRILGHSLGLAPVWIMIAVLVMGEIFGLIGMVLGVPIFTIFYTLMGELCEKKIAKRRAKQAEADALKAAEAISED